MTAGQFFQNTNWFMTGIVLAWVAVTIGYIIVRATESLKRSEQGMGILIYGIWVLVVEVCPCSMASMELFTTLTWQHLRGVCFKLSHVF